MVFNKYKIKDSIKDSFPRFLAFSSIPRQSFHLLILGSVFITLILSGCSSSNHLKQYEFRDTHLAVDAPFAPAPSIVTNSEFDIIDGLEGSVESIFRATTAVVKETKASKARKRMRRAAEDIDVSMLVADGILDRADRALHMIPVGLDDDPDFVLRLDVLEHGLYSGPAFDGRTEFFLDARVELIDNYSGKTLWKKNVNVQEPVSDHLFFSNIRTSVTLSKMDEEEMAEALERISDYTADTVVRVLRKDIARAKH